MNSQSANDLGRDVKTAARRIAGSITTVDAEPGDGASGGKVGCLTEAIMDLSASMCKIASSIDYLAEIVEVK